MMNIEIGVMLLIETEISVVEVLLELLSLVGKLTVE